MKSLIYFLLLLYYAENCAAQHYFNYYTIHEDFGKRYLWINRVQITSDSTFLIDSSYFIEFNKNEFEFKNLNYKHKDNRRYKTIKKDSIQKYFSNTTLITNEIIPKQYLFSFLYLYDNRKTIRDLLVFGYPDPKSRNIILDYELYKIALENEPSIVCKKVNTIFNKSVMITTRIYNIKTISKIEVN
jgi:hypothetical protein